MSYNIYTVRLEPPKIPPANLTSEQAALFDGVTYIRVRAESAQYAAIKGVAMVPWEYVHAFAATAVREPAKA